MLIGTKLKAKKHTVHSRQTSGGYMDFDVLIKDKIYVINYLCKWDHLYVIPCVNDESNCVCWAEVHLFEIIN